MACSSTIRNPADLTKEWLSSKLDTQVSHFTFERIGTGQVSECHRVTLEYAQKNAGPKTVILKVASKDTNSRQAATALQLYQREVRFYGDIAPAIGGPTAQCYHSSCHEDGTFCLLLDDAAPAVVGDDIVGTSVENARLALQELGKIHAATLGREAVSNAKSWLFRRPLNQSMMESLFAQFQERYHDRVKPEHLSVCERLIGVFDTFASTDQGYPIQCLVHGDYRLDNLLFGEKDAKRVLTVMDWQTVSWGPLMTDVAYFLGCSLTSEKRKAHGEDLLHAYHEALGTTPGLTIEQCREEVRRQAFFGVIMAIVSSILVEQTARGDLMFMTLLSRHCSDVLDLDSLSILPEPQVLQPLSPNPEDEQQHDHQPEPFWQESWYFDFISAAHNLGGYIRVGVDKAHARTWYTAILCGPGRPIVAITDFHAPLPDADLTVRTLAFEARHTVQDLLKRFHASLTGVGRAHVDAPALLKPDYPSGEPTPVALDLTWHTDGQPYAYRLTSRYEIPCTISGTVALGGETFAMRATPGQRDHSWSVRDWWAMDWVWSAVHLADGTHVHGLDLRVPNAPRMYMGYVQGADGNGGAGVTELKAHVAEEVFGEDGLPRTTRVRIEPGPLVVELKVAAHGPLRLVADDGRVALFPRAWGAVKTGDGREGVAWMEWNRNVKQERSF